MRSKLKSLTQIIKNANEIYEPFNSTIQIYKNQKVQSFKDEVLILYQQFIFNQPEYLNKMINVIQQTKKQQYQRDFIQTLLPDRPPLQLIIFYLETLFQKINDSTSEPYQTFSNKYALYYIGQNLFRIYKDEVSQDPINDKADEVQISQQYNDLARLNLTAYLQYYRTHNIIQYFDSKFHLKIMILSNHLKVFNPYLLNYFKEKVQYQMSLFNLKDILNIMIYLSADRSLPYQFFYRQKMHWINLIQTSQKYSKKKISCTIKYLKLFKQERLINCQKIVSSLIKIITDSEAAMDSQQLIQALYYYSRIKYGVDIDFVSRLINRISQIINFKKISSKNFIILVKALSNLNYKSESMIQYLKNIDYNLFISSLRLNYAHIGQHYEEILKEIDKEFENTQMQKQLSKQNNEQKIKKFDSVNKNQLLL